MDTYYSRKPLRSHHADTVGVGVADVNRAVAVHKNPMQSVHAAFQWIAYGAIALSPVAGDQLHPTGVAVYHTYRVAFRVSQVNISARAESDALGTR